MIKNRSVWVIIIMVSMMLVIPGCSNNTTYSATAEAQGQSSSQIYLYGEIHSVEAILDREFELWYDYYHEQGMRHLFIEDAYYTAEFLNIWMQSDSDEILDMVHDNSAGTQVHSPEVKAFYQRIKSECPETIFHGTDVGHQHGTTGKQFLEYLRSNGLEDSEQYLLTQEAIEQGERYYRNHDGAYRENMMVENFIREFDKLDDEDIMGIYGAAHTGLEEMDWSNSVPCMANQLKEYYGDNIYSEDLSELALTSEPYRIDTIKVGERDYEALYFGEQDLTKFEGYKHREFWRLEDAYNDFKDSPKTQEVLPYNNYPMRIEEGQVFVIDYTLTDGSVERKYYRSDGRIWNDMPSTEEFRIKQ